MNCTGNQKSIVVIQSSSNVDNLFMQRLLRKAFLRFDNYWNIYLYSQKTWIPIVNHAIA